MEWMKSTCSLVDGEVFGESSVNCSMHGFDLQVELFERGLSEIYVLVLDSLNVTVGNSSVVGRTIKDLMAVIRPYISILVGPEPESVNEFISSVTGRASDVRLAGNTADMLKSTHWVLVFFSRMYMSCRSLYRQAITLVSPDVLRKMSTGSMADCCPLIYVFHTMALQRLVDLNRQIKALEHMQQSNDNFVLEKSVLPLFGDIELNASPKWQEDLSALENSSVVSGRKSSTCDEIAVGKSISHLLSEMPADISRELAIMKFTACQSLLRLLCWMPKGYINSRSFSLYVTCTLNHERFVIGHLLECGDSFFSRKQYELLRLLVTCRKALKYLIMAYCEEKIAQSSLIPILSEDVRSVLWLFKSMSVVFRLQETLSEDNACEVTDMIFSLMDQTSYVFLTQSKYQCTCAVDSIIAEKTCTELPNSDVAQEQSSVNKSNPCLDTSNDFESWKRVIIIAESLEEQTQDLIISLKDALFKNAGDEIDAVDWNKLFSIVSCFCGFMWGLASALDHTNATDSDYKHGAKFYWHAQVLLLKLADGTEVPKPFSFVWLDGVLKYLQELGSHFPITNPTLTRKAYAKLLVSLLKALGKCISLQGKEAPLASRDEQSSTKTLHSHIGSASLSYPYHLDEFKARLRMYSKVSSTVAAALTAWIWFWNMFQEVKPDSPCLLNRPSTILLTGIGTLHNDSSVAALFNIILHVESPLIFYGIAMGSDRDKGPDPGAVILVCVEVLTRVSGKRALFKWIPDMWHGLYVYQRHFFEILIN
ncbi:hypothetical protein NC652_023922 [Populus alba x Populus x berolinensis]|uniref:Uncharacterized protein n=1 Tax=Populus alba x Populus x berolinensis TaxID=444605 RepID=A0AAD6QD23_9ROSI|nr:hypothetical protein NC652_023922 [Populus alba x Populus x berolinensis]KAJ6985688.1 hypothetical protein NC653_023593 [Populus alba x Populus x berolinensis]